MMFFVIAKGDYTSLVIRKALNAESSTRFVSGMIVSMRAVLFTTGT